jgi:hypothetical protein
MTYFCFFSLNTVSNKATKYKIVMQLVTSMNFVEVDETNNIDYIDHNLIRRT